MGTTAAKPRTTARSAPLVLPLTLEVEVEDEPALAPVRVAERLDEVDVAVLGQRGAGHRPGAEHQVRDTLRQARLGERAHQQHRDDRLPQPRPHARVLPAGGDGVRVGLVPGPHSGIGSGIGLGAIEASSQASCSARRNGIVYPARC